MRFLLGVLLALGLAFGVSPAGAATDPAGYRAALAEARALLDRDDLAPEERARRAAETLGGVGAVQLPDGSAIEPGAGALLAPLQQRPPDLDLARARLAALAAELDRSATVLRTPPDAEARLSEVLARAEFAPAQPDPLAEWIDRALAPLVEWVRGWWPTLGVEVPTRPEAVDAPLPLAVVALLVALGVVAVVAIGLRRGVGRPVAAAPVVAERAAGWEETLAEAARLAAAGQYRRAIRARYVATMLRGDTLGQLRFDRALTNRELVASARASRGPAAAARVAELVDRFDRFWYGGIEGSSRDYDDFARLASALWAAA